MFVEIELSFGAGWSYYGGKREFWKTFEAYRLGRREIGELEPQRIEEYEQQFRERFPIALQRLVNGEIERALTARRLRRSSVPRIKMRLVSVQYGSIKPIFDIVGIENGDVLDFVLMALNIYAPAAFNEALEANVDMRAKASVIGDVPSTLAYIQSGSLSSRANDAVGRLWMITNGTLLVPVALALAVLYYAQAGLLRDADGLRAETRDVRLERIEIVKALVDQNKTVSTSIVDQAKHALANEKALQDTLISILREKGTSGGPANLGAPAKVN